MVENQSRADFARNNRFTHVHLLPRLTLKILACGFLQYELRILFATAVPILVLGFSAFDGGRYV